jgi:hypothetical protein
MTRIPFLLITGIGATLATDLWALARRELFGTPLPNFALVGRWLAHMPRGRFRHQSLTRAEAMPGELGIGWAAHYLIGMAFACLPLLVLGRAWMEQPDFTTALMVGLGSVAAPFFIMQPAMGAGIAASKAPRPAAARVQSLAYHLVFGIGLYLSAVAAVWAARIWGT